MIARLLIGAAVGWLASILARTRDRRQVLVNILIGVVGSHLGVAVAVALGVGTYHEIGGWIPVLGAALPLAVLQAVGAFPASAAARAASRLVGWSAGTSTASSEGKD